MAWTDWARSVQLVAFVMDFRIVKGETDAI